MNIIELLKQPKEFVQKCQEHLDALGYTDGYDYERYIREEVLELLRNHIEDKHYGNRALLVDDIVDSMWVLLAKLPQITIPLNYFRRDTNSFFDELRVNFELYCGYGKFSVDDTLITILSCIIKICIHENIDWQSAFAALVEENMSKLDFPEHMRGEVFRDGKCNKKDPQGNLYPWYKPADFSRF
jgi:hypothetical protein